jgi:uncharacterized repeat protein (TIGR03803 family)
MTKIKTYAMAIALLAMFVTAATAPTHAQTFTGLYGFASNVAYPIGAVAQGEDGALYGTGLGGDGPSGPFGEGGIYKITAVGTETYLYAFCAPPANCALSGTESGLTLRPDGHFLGTTTQGTIFDVSATGNLTTLYNVSGMGGSEAAPIEGPDGSFYGVASFGGRPSSCGTIYRITQARFTLLYQFDKLHGCNPAAPMVLGADGNLYGTTVNGGTAGGGVVFQLKLRPGKAAVVTVLANFDEENGHPWSPLVQGNDGDFYGTTSGAASWGSTNGPGTGTVFKVTTSGTLTVLHTLNGTTDGTNPFTGLVQASDGNFYGTAGWYGIAQPVAIFWCVAGCGTLFQITPEGSYSVLHTFDGTGGALPSTTPVQHTNGLLYGATFRGGGCDQTLYCGTFYSWDGNLPPFVKTVQSMGPVGSSVEILGQGFNSSTTVAFNGRPAEVNLQSATSLCTKVPAGATTGFVTVTTSSGTLSSNKKFIVTP